MEYDNTVRDLLGVDFHASDDFPADDSGYGFDNIGDVLSLSPVLMEKYLTAAEKISRVALWGEEAMKPTLAHFQPFLRRPPPPASLFDYDQSGLTLPSSFNLLHQFPVSGKYLLRITLNGQRPRGSDPVILGIWIDRKPVRQFVIDRPDMEGRSLEVTTPINKGEHLVSVSFLKQFEGLPARFNGPNPARNMVITEQRPKPEAKLVLAANKGPPSLAGRVDALDVAGPFDTEAIAPTDSLRKIMVCGHVNGHHTKACPRRILMNLALHAYRRPPTAAEVNALMKLFTNVRALGDSFEEGIAVAIQYLLTSPDFLFRIEHGSNSKPGSAPVAISPYELASRLSYFLWSTMPDDALLRLASSGELRRPEVIEVQVRRMLKDEKSDALVDNFAGQWLQIRNMDEVKPDPERFMEFDDLLRMSAKRETQLFLSHLIREDGSVLDLIDGNYSYIDETMARFYGIPNVTGPEFRRVDLTGNHERSGILTQASVLTVSSYATHTSPVLRGKWILENILNTPPPPPPPDVPSLDVAEVGTSVSLRQQMEKHRANPICAGCHGRMDPLGFSLENYDAVGAWRSHDGKFPIDASGKLPDGALLDGAAGLKDILLQRNLPLRDA